jgi:hypothetical protein
MISSGYKNSIGILGASVFKEEYTDFLKGKKIIIAYDADFAGRRNTARISEILSRSGIPTSSVELPDDYDVASYLAEGHKELKIVQIENLSGSDKELTYIRSGKNLLLYKFGIYDIHVSDIVERRGSLKANISIFRGPKIINTSSVNLNSQRSRQLYAKELANSTNKLSTSEAKSMLLDLCNALKTKLKDEKEDEPAGRTYILSDIEKEEAEQFLRSDKLLYKVKCALDRQGIIGEDRNKLILYLILTSRLMKKPISCILKGLSSSGKTYIMSKTLTLIPPEGYISIQDATAKALYYMGETDLQHKMILIGEIHGTEGAQYSMREAQDGMGDGDLKIITVEKDPETNQMMTQTRTVKGPCGFVTSTTDVTINPENETRNFSLYVKIDEEKVEKTAIVLVDRYRGKSKILQREELLLLHNAQRCLQTSIRVKIPYVEYVLKHFPTSPIRVMRDRERFLVLIETIAILHQFQREIHKDKNENLWLDATVSDYNIAVKLLDEILVETIYELPPKSKEIYDAVNDIMGDHISQSIGDPENLTLTEDIARSSFFTTYKKIAEYLEKEKRMKMKKEEIRRWSKPLFEAGYFEYYEGEDPGGKKNRGGRGKETKLIPVEKEFYGKFLPSPESVAEFLNISDERIYDPITGSSYTIQLKTEEVDVGL